jgi:hypothetical protein
MAVGGPRHSPAALTPFKTRYPMYRRLGGPQDRSGLVRKISPPQGFDPRTVQRVTSPIPIAPLRPTLGKCAAYCRRHTQLINTHSFLMSRVDVRIIATGFKSLINQSIRRLNSNTDGVYK